MNLTTPHPKDREEAFNCELCHGTGELQTMESVYGSGEPHMAPIGIEVCPCKLPDPEDYDEDDDLLYED